MSLTPFRTGVPCYLLYWANEFNAEQRLGNQKTASQLFPLLVAQEFVGEDVGHLVAGNTKRTDPNSVSTLLRSSSLNDLFGEDVLQDVGALAESFWPRTHTASALLTNELSAQLEAPLTSI